MILAAGEGRRLGPLTDGRPKPMVPVGNRPILESVLDAAIDAGAGEVVLVVGHCRERIQNHFGDGDGWGVPISYVVQDHQLGAAHALSQVAERVDGPFVTLHGDQLVDPELVARLVDRYEATAQSTIAVVQSDRPTEYGAVDVDGERVRSVSATPTEEPPFLVNAGAYVFDEAVFAAIDAAEPRETREFGMATMLQRLADDGALSAVVHRGPWRDVTHPWDLLATNAQLLHERATEQPPRASTGRRPSRTMSPWTGRSPSGRTRRCCPGRPWAGTSGSARTRRWRTASSWPGRGSATARSCTTASSASPSRSAPTSPSRAGRPGWWRRTRSTTTWSSAGCSPTGRVSGAA
ncbi:sugar phosphate nucleotidyltransferase [Halomicroarcula sp. GCM10025709]|uniref:sugar phosphate nucleotidyltransferase n=1 Tax=Halomicroarcula sp. GCM10025709 TaxID=3252669 RepID=UPI00361E2EA8